MKKFLLALVAIIGLAWSGTAAETVLWKGSQALEWSMVPKVDKALCQNFEVGGEIVVHYTLDASASYYSLGVIPGNWGNLSWGSSGAVTAGSTVKSFGPITEEDLTRLKNEGFGLMGNGVTATEIRYRTPSGPVDPTIVMKDPVTINQASGSVEVTYDQIVAAGGVVGGGVQVEYKGIEGQSYYVDFLHQGDADNQYTWCQFSNPVVTENEGVSILHLTESTMAELNTYSKNLIIQCGYVTVNIVKIILPADMPEAPEVKSVKLDKTSLDLKVGENATLTATANPADAAITWSSSDPAVATVENGVVTAVAAGTATITAAIDGAKAECTVTVKENIAAGIYPIDNYGKAVTAVEMYLGDNAARVLFRTVPEGEAVKIELQNADPADFVSFYSYEPSQYWAYYNCEVSPSKAGTGTLVASLVSDPTVKVEIPVTVKDYAEPTLIIKPSNNAIDQEAVAPCQGDYSIFAVVKKVGGSDDRTVLRDKTYSYAYSSSNPEVAYVDYTGEGRYKSTATVKFTGKAGTATIKVVMTPPEGGVYGPMEATTTYTVLPYGEGSYTFNYYTDGWQAAYGFPEEGDFTDFTAKSNFVDMFFSNGRVQGSALPLAGSYYEFIAGPQAGIVGVTARTSGGRGDINSTTTVDNGTLSGNTWTPAEADAQYGVQSVRFNSPDIQYNMSYWDVKLICYAQATVALDATEASVETGKTTQLKATVTGDHINPNAKTVWTSSDEKVATVDENGVVTGVAEGTAIITAANCGGEASCTVTVKAGASIKATDKNGEEVTSIEAYLGDNTPRILFPTVPAGQAVTIEMQNSEPAGVVKLYTYKPGSTYASYNCEVSFEKAGTATLVAYLTADPEVKVEIPVTVKDYTEPTLMLSPYSEAIDNTKVSPCQGSYTVWAEVKLPGGEGDWDIASDDAYKYEYTTSDPEIATVAPGDNSYFKSVETITFTGKAGDVTIKVVMTPPADSKYSKMEASLTFTVLPYGEGVYSFDYKASGWEAKYGFPESGDVTDFTAKSLFVNMFFSNATIQGLPIPNAGSYYEFIAGPQASIIGVTASTGGNRGGLNSTTTADKGSIKGNTWTPDAADAETGVESVRFNSPDRQYGLPIWQVKVICYAQATVELDADEAELAAGETKQLTAAVSGDHIKPNAKTIWSSSDEAIATVDAEGLVTAVAEGTATITAANCGGEATCKVIVSKMSGIEDVTVDGADDAEYFNLQGVRVENPAPGLYIKRQGNKATKVIIR